MLFCKYISFLPPGKWNYRLSFVTCPPCNDVESGPKKSTSRAALCLFFVYFLPFFNFIRRLLANTITITNIAIPTSFSHTRNASSDERQVPS